MKKLLLALLLIPALAGAQDFKHRYFHYDQYYDAPTPFQILSTAQDGADTSTIAIGAGGAATHGRGAYISMAGSDVGGANAGGYILLRPSSGSDGRLTIYSGTGGGTNSVVRLTVPVDADTDNADVVLGTATTTAPIFTIRGQTADGDDDGTLRFAAGGDVSASRGGYIQLQGNEASGGSDLYISTGSASGSDITVTGAAANSTITFALNGQNRWAWEPDGDMVQDGTNGGDIIMSQTDEGILNGAAAIDADISSVTGAGTGFVFQRDNSASYNGALVANGANAYGPYLLGFKTRSAAGDANTIVNANDSVYDLVGYGADGIVYRPAARIRYAIDEAPGSGDMPGRIMFATTPNGASALADRWTIPTGALKTMSLMAKNYADDDIYALIGVSPNNGDGHDEGYLEINGGGAAGYSRGANITVYGNEHASNGGDVFILGGNVGGGDIQMRTIGTGADLYFGASSYGGDRGAYMMLEAIAEELTIPVGSGAAGVVTAGNVCASGMIAGVAARVTDAPGGGATTFDIGCTGSGNLDQFVDGRSTALNTTGRWPVDGDGTNTPWVQKAATTMTVTTDANVTGDDMKIRIVTYYWEPTVPTS